MYSFNYIHILQCWHYICYDLSIRSAKA